MYSLDGLHFRSGIRRAVRIAYCGEQFDIIDVIAHITDVSERDAELVAYLLRRLQFGQTIGIHSAADTEIEEPQFEFFCPRLDDRRVLGRQDAARDTGLLEANHPHAVIDAETLEFVAIGGVIQPAVGKASVHVGKEESNWLHWRYTV